MATNSPLFINTAIPKQTLTPKLVWIWTDNGEGSCLWPRQKLSDNEINDPNWKPLVSEEFFDAVCASNRLWILDPYFDYKVGLRSIWDALSGAVSDIRILSHEQKPTLLIEELERKRPIQTEIQWKVSFEALHDRFAILDDEVWHFGSTVGGGYFRFGAASRGWPVGDLAKLFNNRWTL